MRSFLAIDLPEKLKEEISLAGWKMAKDREIKLVEKENLHLTLVFLGEITEEEKKKVAEVLKGVKGRGEIRLRLGDIEIFPNEGKPRGVWINIGGEKEKLFSLYKKIIDSLLNTGIKLEEKELRFSPHITIGRFKGKGKSTKKISQNLQIEGEFVTRNITLFSSQLSSQGPCYRKVAEFEL